MKEEVKNELEKVKEKFINHYCDRFQISDDIRGMYEDEFITKIANLSEQIIQLLEDEHLTYKDSYFLLEFTYKSLKYKQEQVSL